MTTQKKKDLKDQYQVTDLKEYNVMRTRTTAYPSKKAMEEKFKAEQEVIQLKLQQEKLQREQEELASNNWGTME